MRTMAWPGLSLLALFLLPFCGCGGTGNGSTPAPVTPAPLSAANINLIFVVSEDLNYQASGNGDLNQSTGNLTNQGLQRSLLMAPFLQKNVLGGNNVTGIYALAPMTHLQTANQYPDMVALETIQQFALLNKITLPNDQVGTTQYTANSFPLNAGYGPGLTFGPGTILSGVAPPLIYCEGCQGLDFLDTQGVNESLVTGSGGIIAFNVPGFYIFSAPWETTQSLVAGINTSIGEGKYDLTLPASYQGPDYIYAISIAAAPSESASLVTFNSNVSPPSTYPVLPSPKLVSAQCPITGNGAQTYFNIQVTSANGTIPAGINKNETVYMMRHAEAHPTLWWEDGNYVAAGQWRALDLPYALLGKLNPIPTQIYSIDPAQATPSGRLNFSYVRPSLTVEPYAIASGLPYNLVADLEMFNIPGSVKETNQFFFNDPPFPSNPLLPQQPPSFSGQTVLLAWEHSHFQPMVEELLESYNYSGGQPVSFWPDTDYDSIWTVTLDGVGNLSVNNALCEGIDSAKLPVTAPQF
ncbi:MAG: hypothetical protein ABSA80_06765 [Terriglobales bacterium]